MAIFTILGNFKELYAERERENVVINPTAGSSTLQQQPHATTTCTVYTICNMCTLHDIYNMYNCKYYLRAFSCSLIDPNKQDAW